MRLLFRDIIESAPCRALSGFHTGLWSSDRSEGHPSVDYQYYILGCGTRNGHSANQILSIGFLPPMAYRTGIGKRTKERGIPQKTGVTTLCIPLPCSSRDQRPFVVRAPFLSNRTMSLSRSVNRWSARMHLHADSWGLPQTSSSVALSFLRKTSF